MFLSWSLNGVPAFLRHLCRYFSAQRLEAGSVRFRSWDRGHDASSPHHAGFGSDRRPLLVGMGVRIPVGIFLLSTISPEIITRFLGAVLLGTAVVQATFRRDQKFRFPKSFGLPIGITSGMLGEAFDMGGPPVLVFLQSRLSDPKVLVATLQMVFAVSMIFHSGVLVSFGFVTLHTLFLVVIGILPAWIGIMVSTRFQRFIAK